MPHGIMRPERRDPARGPMLRRMEMTNEAAQPAQTDQAAQRQDFGLYPSEASEHVAEANRPLADRAARHVDPNAAIAVGERDLLGAACCKRDRRHIGESCELEGITISLGRRGGSDNQHGRIMLRIPEQPRPWGGTAGCLGESRAPRSRNGHLGTGAVR